MEIFPGYIRGASINEVEEPNLLVLQSPTLSRSDLQQSLAMALQRFACLVTRA